MQRSTISVSPIVRRSNPSSVDTSIMSFSISGSGMGVRLPGLVAVPACAGLLPETIHLADAIRDGGVAEIFGPRRRLPLSDRPPDVEPGEIRHRERSHGKPELEERAIDLLRQCTFLEEKVRLTPVGVEHSVADETVTHTDEHADFAEALSIASSPLRWFPSTSSHRARSP